MMGVMAAGLGSLLGAAVAVGGLLLAGLCLRWFLRAQSRWPKLAAILLMLVGVGLLGGGIWYGLVGAQYGRVEKVEKRQAGKNVKKLIGRFAKLLRKCKHDVFPKMPYAPSAKARQEGYATAIKVVREELLKCYTGSADVGQEKSVELKQIKWLVARKSCDAFAKRLIEERTFCPQMIESLIGKAGFKDPLAEVEGESAAPEGRDARKATADVDPKMVKEQLQKLGMRMQKCAREVLRGYKAPSRDKVGDMQKKAVAAMLGALTACALDEEGAELTLAQIEKLLKSPDCKTMGRVLRELGACAPALEAPLKAGFKYDMKAFEKEKQRAARNAAN
jgi:hypothetical protein